MPRPALIVRSDGTHAAVERALRDRRIHRVRHGVYLDAALWRAATREERMRIAAHALAHVARGPVFAGLSAAALWGLPLHGADDERVHVIEAGGRPASSRGDVVRHKVELASSDVVERDGLRVTSLARTVYDVIRSAGPETAVTVFDAALRLVAWRGGGRYDDDAGEAFRDEVRRRIEAAPGARGVRQARFLADFADGRAQLPGESVSRLWMHRLGTERPELQREVAIAQGRAFLDFCWPRLRRFGEFDGDGKYLDVELTQGRTPGAVLDSQREREMAVIAATGWTPLRWGWRRLDSLATFERFLRAQRLLPPR